MEVLVILSKKANWRNNLLKKNPLT